MAKVKQAAGAPRLYSYIRYSTPEQRFGDSERRQLQAAREYADRHGLQLDDDLKLIDSGRSGYKGHNRTKGALGAFLKSIEAGEVPAGSTLLVENIDRLSREDCLTAIDTVRRIVDCGITIVTLMPYAEYTRDTIKGGLVWQLVGQIQAAYEQSASKSRRIKAARERERELARLSSRPTGKNCPAWLRFVAEPVRRYEVIPEAAETIRLIYQLRAEGLGTRAIERRLNAGAPWTPPLRPHSKYRPGSGWRTSYIKKILQNPAVIGECQPYENVEGGRAKKGEPITDFFPPVVSEDLYHTVRQLMEANRGKGGKTGKASNLLAHVAKCAYCGGPMAYEDKGKPPKGARYLVCDNGRRGVRCSRYRIRYDECEALLLGNCPKLRTELVLPQPDDKAAKLNQLRMRVRGSVGKLAELDRHLGNLTDQIVRTDSQRVRDTYQAKLVEMYEQQKALEDQKAKDERELAKLEQDGQTFIKWQRTVRELKAALTQNDPELRMRLRAHLRELITKVEVFAVGYPDRYDVAQRSGTQALNEVAPSGKRRVRHVPHGPSIGEWEKQVDEVASAPDADITRTLLFFEFVQQLNARRMSRDGRFVRVWFTTGAVVDLVPPGSLADGFKLVRSGQGKWQFVEPDVDALWRQFVANQTPVDLTNERQNGNRKTSLRAKSGSRT